MVSKTKEKELAIQLRKQGKSYSEIRRIIPVAKSTLSIWFREVHLSKRQEQKITIKRIEAQKRGAEAKRKQRLEKTKTIKNIARREVTSLIKNPLWIVGVVIYWAEGAKEKEWRVSEKTKISNMDPHIHKIFISWAKRFLKISSDRFIYELYIHPTGDIFNSKKYWSKQLHVSTKKIRVYFKKPNHNPKKYNTRENYHGVLTTMITKGTDVNRKIAGWVEGMIDFLSKNSGIV